MFKTIKIKKFKNYINENYQKQSIYKSRPKIHNKSLNKVLLKLLTNSKVAFLDIVEEFKTKIKVI